MEKNLNVGLEFLANKKKEILKKKKK